MGLLPPHNITFKFSAFVPLILYEETKALSWPCKQLPLADTSWNDRFSHPAGLKAQETFPQALYPSLSFSITAPITIHGTFLMFLIFVSFPLVHLIVSSVTTGAALAVFTVLSLPASGAALAEPT